MINYYAISPNCGLYCTRLAGVIKKSVGWNLSNTRHRQTPKQKQAQPTLYVYNMNTLHLQISVMFIVTCFLLFWNWRFLYLENKVYAILKNWYRWLGSHLYQ